MQLVVKKEQTHKLGLLKLMSRWRIGTLIYFKSISLTSLTIQYVKHWPDTQQQPFLLLPYLHFLAQ